ncbi:hypothetical protein ES703_20550 [subsurface metagenome]
MSQEEKVLVKTCKLEVVPDDKSGRGYKIIVIGDCSEEIEQIRNSMGPQGYRYLKKRLIQDK